MKGGVYMTDNKEEKRDVVDPLPESSGVEEANADDPRALDVVKKIPKTTELKGTGTNEANLGQEVADASGDQTDSPNPEPVNQERLDKANKQGVSVSEKLKDKYETVKSKVDNK
jgi:hypothetical protein